jgi:hypothetical protein
VPRALSPKQNGLFYRIGSKSGSRQSSGQPIISFCRAKINNACPRRRLHNACRPHDKSPAVSSQNPIRRRNVYISPKNCKLAHGSALWESTPAEPPEPLTAYRGQRLRPSAMEFRRRQGKQMAPGAEEPPRKSQRGSATAWPICWERAIFFVGIHRILLSKLARAPSFLRQKHLYNFEELLRGFLIRVMTQPRHHDDLDTWNRFL